MHLSAERAAAWSALRLAMDAAGGEAVTAEQVARYLSVLAPRAAAQPLRVELLLEGLAVDGRTSVWTSQPLGGGEPCYGM